MNTLIKYYNTTDIDMYTYRRKKMIDNYSVVFQIPKKGMCYVCSKERFEQIDCSFMESPRTIIIIGIVDN